jgi:rsbT co-antagonist protein RsbR
MNKTQSKSELAAILAPAEEVVLSKWMRLQNESIGARRELVTEKELSRQSRDFLRAFTQALHDGADSSAEGPSWASTREVLSDLSRERAQRGLSPIDTAMFVFSLKEALFEHLQETAGVDQLGPEMWKATLLLDRLGLYTTEVYQKSREEIIRRQQRELLELSTPVVQLWQGVLAIPLIGTLDSERTQVVMENLLERIVETGAPLAIIDITGVPTVDTLVAQHLLKTVAAARLMGADCIISGIRPQIAQTIVHLGVDLSAVTTKATLADAFLVALKRSGCEIIRPATATATAR